MNTGASADMVVYSLNGQIIGAEDPFLSPESRAYRYGDGFFESMRFINGRLLHGNLHFIRIRKSAMLLKMQLPDQFDQDKLEQWITEAAADGGMDHARVRCTILRDSPGLYTPVSSQTMVILELRKLDGPAYDWNEEGLKLGAYKELSKNSNYTSMLKTTSALTYVMAGMYARENGYDECVVFNEQGRVAECISSNIFVVSGEFINTPPLSEYCIDGVMRRVVMQLAEAYGYTMQEQPITEISLNSAEELFLTSAGRGIRWVGTYAGKRYKNTHARVLFNMLNKGLVENGE